MIHFHNLEDLHLDLELYAGRLLSCIDAFFCDGLGDEAERIAVFSIETDRYSRSNRGWSLVPCQGRSPPTNNKVRDSR